MRINSNHWLKSNPIAHRGLWGGNVKENSITAFKLAAQKGYPIETDVWLTADGELVCFHDSWLKRVTGADGYVYEKTLAQLKELNLDGSLEKIPSLKEVLSAVSFRVPMLIEIKNQPSKKVVEKLLEVMKGYKGEFAIQSFNPLYLLKVKKFAPEVIRGVLSAKNVDDKSAFKRFIVKTMPLNFLIKPDFISYDYRDLPLKASKRKGLPIIAWTVENQSVYDKIKPHVDNIIFEKFAPKNQ